MEFSSFLMVFVACCFAVFFGNVLVVFTGVLVTKKVFEAITEKERQNLEKYVASMQNLKDAIAGIKKKEEENMDFTVPLKKKDGGDYDN